MKGRQTDLLYLNKCFEDRNRWNVVNGPSLPSLEFRQPSPSHSDNIKDNAKAPNLIVCLLATHGDSYGPNLLVNYGIN